MEPRAPAYYDPHQPVEPPEKPNTTQDPLERSQIGQRLWVVVGFFVLLGAALAAQLVRWQVLSPSPPVDALA
ncbi:MAG: hypothetical protein GX605_08850, partial [Chloroflexi bacterium]|nr:hypothetical protein [Chloroflexota bacterium]